MNANWLRIPMTSFSTFTRRLKKMNVSGNFARVKLNRLKRIPFGEKFSIVLAIKKKYFTNSKVKVPDTCNACALFLLSPWCREKSENFRVPVVKGLYNKHLMACNFKISVYLHYFNAFYLPELFSTFLLLFFISPPCAFNHLKDFAQIFIQVLFCTSPLIATLKL